MKVAFTAAADRELQDIETYIAMDDAIAAKRVAEDLVSACLALEHAPGRGSLIGTRRGVELRRLVRHRYLIVYSIGPDVVRIHRVIHGARAPKLLLKGLDLP